MSNEKMRRGQGEKGWFGKKTVQWRAREINCFFLGQRTQSDAEDREKRHRQSEQTEQTEQTRQKAGSAEKYRL